MRIVADAPINEESALSVRAELAARSLAPAAMLLANAGLEVQPDTLAAMALDIADALLARLNLPAPSGIS